MKIKFMIHSLRLKLRKSLFITTPISAVINSAFIIRNGIYKSILKIAPTLRGDILDFGCGSKPYESLFKNKSSYVGIDIKESVGRAEGVKVDLIYDGEKLPFEDSKFHAVVSFEVFEHIFNAEEMLNEINRVLKPNGQFLLSIPFSWGEHEAPFDYARYTSFGITHMLEKNGFQVVELKKTTTYFLATGQMLIIYLAQHILPKGRFLGLIAQIFVIFPITACFFVLDFFLPKSYECFCNCVVLSRKISSK